MRRQPPPICWEVPLQPPTAGSLALPFVKHCHNAITVKTRTSYRGPIPAATRAHRVVLQSTIEPKAMTALLNLAFAFRLLYRRPR